MLTNIKLGFGALSVMILVGCGAGQVDNGTLSVDQDIESAKEDSACRKSHPEFYKCDVDADCVAIEKAGCCPNGFQVAVNKNEVKAYETKYACTTPPATCPLFIVNDKRVAQCDFQAHTCHMIDPTQIHCGGFINPSHACPDGFSCNFGGHVPDVGGSCVASAQ
jgi:hypothetical protein